MAPVAVKNYSLAQPELDCLIALCVKVTSFARNEAKAIELKRLESEVDKFILQNAIEVAACGDVTTAAVEVRCATQPVTTSTPKLSDVRERLKVLDAVPVSKAMVPNFVEILRRGAATSAMRSLLENPLATPEEAIAKFAKVAAIGNQSGKGTTNQTPDVDAWLDDLLRKVSTEELIKTGCLEIDELLCGGFEKHSLWAACAGTGEGKSFFLSSLAAEYLHRKKNVIVFSLELAEEQWIMRVLENLAGESRVKPELFKTRYKDYLHKREIGRVSVIKMQSNVSTVDDMRRVIQDLYDDGHPRFELCCIDYLDLAAPPKSSKSRDMKSHEEAKYTYEEARRLCLLEEHNLVDNVWTVSQIRDRDTRRNKTGDVNKQDASDSSWKMRTVDGAISIKMSEQDRGDRQRRYGLMKRRNSDDSSIETPPVPQQLNIGRLWPVTRG